MRKSYNVKKLYANYVAQFEKTRNILINKGFDKTVTGVAMANEEEFANQLKLFSSSRTGKKSGYTNFVRQLATKRFYVRTLEQAKNLADVLNTFGITEINGKKITLDNLRVYGLADLNEALKKAGYSSSYDRASYIAYFVYDSD